MKKITFLFIFLSGLFAFSQINPIDFESGGNGADWTYTTFANADDPALEIIDNPLDTGLNSSAKVARFTAREAGETFAGFFTEGQGVFTLDATNSTVTIMVYKTVISDVGIKFETATGGTTGEIKVANTLVNQWEQLTFDFSSKIGQPQSTDIKRLVIFPDFQDRATENIILLDNIVFSAQITTEPDGSNMVTVDASDAASLLGYANVFDLPEDGGAYQFGNEWGLADLKTTVDVPNNSIILQPNFNTYNSTDPFWVDPTTLEGNKTFQGSTYIENDALVGSELTFTAEVTENTLDDGYTAEAYISVFVDGYSTNKTVTTPLETGTFTVTYSNVEASDAHVQYGFRITGPNANPDDEAALGSIVVTSVVLGINELSKSEIKLFPNPAYDSWNLKTVSAKIESISVMDILGKNVMNLNVDSNSANIPSLNLTKGMYFAKVNTDQGSAVLKLIKN